MTAHPTVAYKILTADQWAAWRRAGTFAGASIDLTDGYIHLSSAATAGDTYRLFFAGKHDDLVVAEVDLQQLGGSVKWEASRGGQLFPHVYGTIPLAAVKREWEGVDGGLFERLVEEGKGK